MRVPSKSKNAATFGPSGTILICSMSSSTVITGGVVLVISRHTAAVASRPEDFVVLEAALTVRVLLRRGREFLSWRRWRAYYDSQLVSRASPSCVTAVPWDNSGHPTMKTQNRWAKSVGAKYPLCGVENRPMW
jgi:hypothetical protein